MVDSKLQSLPTGSGIQRTTGEILVIRQDGWERYAICTSAGNAPKWYFGRTVSLTDLASSKYEVFSLPNSTCSYKDNQPKMETLTAIAKRLLDSNTKTLIKAGFMDNALNLTYSGQAALNAIVADEHKDALVAAAQEAIDEAKDN